MEIAFVDCLGEAHADHHAIFAAFRSGDAARVSILSRLHAEATAKRFVNALSARELVEGLPHRGVTDLGPAAILDPDAAKLLAKPAA
jgi:hypothetical protein